MSIFLMKISLSVTCSLKWCSFTFIYFVCGLYLWFVAISSAPMLSLNTLHLIVHTTWFTGKLCFLISCSNCMRGMTSLSSCDSPVCSYFVDDRYISVCS